MPTIDDFKINDGHPSDLEPRILIVRLSSIGDVVMNTGVAELLRRYYPKAYIAWAVEQKSAEAVIGNPYLDEVIVWPRFRPLKRLGDFAAGASDVMRRIRDLRERKFDIAFDFQGLARSALVIAASGAPIRVGFSHTGEGSTLTYTDKVVAKGNCVRVGEHYEWVLTALGIEPSDTRLCFEVPDEAYESARAFLESQNISGNQPYICLCPATTWRQKHWLEERWSVLIDQLYERFGFQSVILGGPADGAMARRIADGARNKPVIATGKLKLKESGALIANAPIAVSVDTGLLFIAIALETPVVGIFGPTTSAHLSGEPMVSIIQKPVDCFPCRRNRWTCTDFDCMQRVEVEDVIRAVESRLRTAVK